MLAPDFNTATGGASKGAVMLATNSKGELKGQMFAYFGMLAVPSALSLVSPKSKRLLLFLVGILYFLMVGFRFRVGMDWDNYLDIYESAKNLSLIDAIVQREPGYAVLMWIGAKLGLGMVFVNAVSALVFCWGLFAVAGRCREPWLAILVATPLLVIAFAMSGVRQALAAGVIFQTMAHWSEYRTSKRILHVVIASAFHFSALFVMIFVAIGSHASSVIRIGGAIIISLAVVAVVLWAPESAEGYTRLYVGGGRVFTAPGAVFQIAPLAFAAILYLINKRPWIEVNGYNPLYHQIAWASLLAVPAIMVSSVGAYRFALYFWPMAMTVYSDYVDLVPSSTGRFLHRFLVILAACSLLVGWLLLANNSHAWLPYQNWLLQPDGVPLSRRYRH